ncbi:Zn-dependent alcohol dehydrogenase [Actinomadura algeriensis]|uniref:S-(Hydroxymethyl)glutathione dehydrogenase/alcohol dehydrogenase n=1 Tax=Actinomadura algeriensis TaxID=1679523 RepID=A0ABR9K289_9ACTN|nr:Zn-dependent alcohol dehydrogenase [Actinomadura algeriensis]MBE1536980.1 S-(hydroxymethyl)glutathione dehydrogenase/alcohol dehydrogenase [Actinomadura algeriensis]
MKAAVLHEFEKDLVIEDVGVAEPGPDEVLVRTVASGVCHSDRTMQLGANALPLPLLLGHEPAGVVERVGSNVAYVRPGDHVAACASSFCGHCRWCQRGEPQHCENKNRSRPAGEPPRLSLDGAAVEPFVGLGGFAEKLLVHERTLVRLPPEMPLDKAAILGCAVITGLGAVRRAARVRPGETVAVIGCGGVGLNVVQGARLAGAGRVIAVDRLAPKLELAQRFGATDVVDAGACDPVEAVRDLTGGGVDHAIEVVGVSATIEQAFRMLDTMGVATVVGVARPDVQVRIPAVDLLLEKRLQGTKMGSTRFRLDIPLYCDLYVSGRLMLDELISETVPVERVNEALAKLDNPLGARTILTF